MNRFLFAVCVVLFLASIAAAAAATADARFVTAKNAVDATVVNVHLDSADSGHRNLISSPSCNVCSNASTAVRTLTLRYDLPSATSSLQGKNATCVQATYPDTADISLLGSTVAVKQGTGITIGGSFPGKLEFNISGFGKCFIDTSCSSPLVIGDKIGPFLVVAGNDCPALAPTSSPTKSPTRNPTQAPTRNPVTRSPTTFGTPCNMCSNDATAVRNLTLRYDLPSATSTLQGMNATCVQAIYPETAVVNLLGSTVSVKQGTGITIGGSLPGKLEFNISGFGKCYIDTSCSSPLVVGDKIGPFLVVSGNDCPALVPTSSPTRNPTQKPTTIPTTRSPTTFGTPCNMCSNAATAVRNFTLRYDLPSATSSLQGTNATCVQATYPETASISLLGSTVSVKQGTGITIGGSLPGKLEFDISGFGKCYIDTSCSSPLVVGDKIGPFLVVAGNDCPALAPTSSPTKTPTSRPTLTPTRIPTQKPTTIPTTRSPTTLGTPCNMCSNAATAVRNFTLRYDLPSATSTLQGMNATCVQATYPETADVSLLGSTVAVKQGTSITIGGSLPGKLEFDISGFGKCYIDTSCSSPLVVGDKIGPFLVVAGNDCPALAPTSKPTQTPTRNPTQTPTSNPTTRIPTSTAQTPTKNPTQTPTTNPTTRSPTSTTLTPTRNPTPTPTTNPTTRSPTSTTLTPTRNPTKAPTTNPTTRSPTSTTLTPTANPTTRSPTSTTKAPTTKPTTGSPTSTPQTPTSKPSQTPTRNPTQAPTRNPITRSPTTLGTPCDICSNAATAVRTLTLRYDLPSATSSLQGKNATCVQVSYPETASISLLGSTVSVKQGTGITIGGSFPGRLEFDISGFGKCFIDTSCSSPLVVGDKIGPFLVVAGNDCPALAPTSSPTKSPTRNPTQAPTRNPVTRSPTTLGTPCNMCSNDATAVRNFTFRYDLPSATSSLQARNATCVQASYPETASISLLGSTVSVKQGTGITIGGSLPGKLEFDISGFGKCFIDTSCSSPLVVGDKIGPFLVVSGNDCPALAPTSSPTKSPTNKPTQVPTRKPVTRSPTTFGTPCNMCSNAATAVRNFTLRYDLPSATSSLQGKNATCVQSTYPDAANITLLGSTVAVKQGTGITIGGILPGRLEFDISGFGKCYIDTSCSSPLVIGDKIGPFLVVAGNDCPALAPTSKPTQAPTTKPTTRSPTLI